ncbi:hypothetical protein ATO6_19295 [Oceanicola sp. 22II-s10i]|uniref:YraN family protein n=1 Tax=Oceanicola sp. 22II-s10i TaxID=1317116 RepID=UPI000B527A61|nr:YraN family protein [Oceanicola sp. 22II-s10i]OWU83285.1 hypothetical protein ATO6_19295 [Oceanicola sp. 22II-s10i]
MKHWTPPSGPSAPAGDRSSDQRRRRGRRAHQAGAAAELTVERTYCDRGYRLAERRWRGRSGEIDLIFRRGAQVIFVEVKCGPDFDRALAQLGPGQIARIGRASCEYTDRHAQGSLTEVRFDVGLVDRRGAVRIIENALAA